MKIDLKNNVRAFHQIFGMNDPTSPTVPADDVVRLRAKLITEEYFETMRALFTPEFHMQEAENCARAAINCARISVNLPEFVDGLADLEYVCEGSFLAFGVDSAPIHAEVQRSNMAKVGGEVRADGKRMKPPGWTPPRIQMEIDIQILNAD